MCIVVTFRSPLLLDFIYYNYFNGISLVIGFFWGVFLIFKPQRRPGCRIVVFDGELDTIKQPPNELVETTDRKKMMVSLEDGHGTPLFITRNKTPPRYPPPKPKDISHNMYHFRYDKVLKKQKMYNNNWSRTLQLPFLFPWNILVQLGNSFTDPMQVGLAVTEHCSRC